MEKFKAYRINEVEKKTVAGFVEMSRDELDPGEVILRVAYSGINYRASSMRTASSCAAKPPKTTE